MLVIFVTPASGTPWALNEYLLYWIDIKYERCMRKVMGSAWHFNRWFESNVTPTYKTSSPHRKTPFTFLPEWLGSPVYPVIKHSVPSQMEFPWIITAQFSACPGHSPAADRVLHRAFTFRWLHSSRSSVLWWVILTAEILVAMLGKSKWVFILPPGAACVTLKPKARYISLTNEDAISSRSCQLGSPWKARRGAFPGG